MAIQNLANKALDMVRGRKHQIDKGLDKAQQSVSEKTGGKYDEKIGSARERADKFLSEEGTGSESGGQRDTGADDRPEDGSGPSQQR